MGRCTVPLISPFGGDHHFNSVKFIFFAKQSYNTRAQNVRKNLSNGRKKHQTGANWNSWILAFLTLVNFCNIFHRFDGSSYEWGSPN